MSPALALVVVLGTTAGCGRYRFDARSDGSTSVADSVDLGDSAVAIAPSCRQLPSSCGPASSASCCATIAVPGGTFARGYDVSGDGMYPDSTKVATVSDFHLDTYEVTVGRFRQFVIAGLATQSTAPAAGAGAHANIAGSGWDTAWNVKLAATTAALTTALQCDATYQTWTNTPAANENKPINCVTWYEAMAFCAWDGGYLPTEAQWNYTAAGGSEQRAYPWSSPASSLAISCTQLDYMPSTACVNGGPDDVGSESPAGDGKWGHADLAGNVFEWTLDWDAAYPLPCSDCANLTASAMRALRGGDFGDPAINERTAYRGNAGAPTNRDSGVGMRCARP